MKDYTILLIEDEKNIADFVEKILRSNDYQDVLTLFFLTLDFLIWTVLM